MADDKVTTTTTKPGTLEDVGRLVQSIEDSAKRYEEDNKTRDEAMATVQKQVVDLTALVEKLRREYPTEPLALTEQQGEYAARKGGLFKRGEPTLKAQDVLAISPRNPMLRGEDAELVKDLQDAWDACVFKYQVEAFTKYNRPDAFQVALDNTRKGPDYKRLENLLEHAGYAKTLIHPASGGIAEPLTFTLVSAQVVDLVRMALRVGNQFVQIPLSATSQKIPVNRGDAIGVLMGVAATDPPPTQNITGANLIPGANHFGTIAFGTADFACKDVGAFLWWSDRAVVDSMVPLLPYLRDMVVFAHARAIDRACMSGDIAGTHMDDWNTDFTAQDARHMWNGLRALGYAVGKLDNAGAIYETEELRAQRKALGVYGLVPSDLALWLSPGPLFDFMGSTDVRTMEVFGPQATVKTGTIAMADGVSIIPTEWMPTDMDDTNGTSVSGGTKTGAMLANVRRFALGQYGTMAVETTRWAPMQTTIIQATGYYDFVPFEGVDGTTKRFTATSLGTGNPAPCNYMVDVSN